MSDNVQYKGFWWLLNKPDDKVAGILTFSPFEIPSLELIGHFTVDSDQYRIDIILGSCGGRAITLYKCIGTHFSYVSKQEQNATSFVANFLFIGVHFEGVEAIKFRRMYVHYEYLDSWIDTSGFRNPVLEESGLIEIAYQEPDTISIPVNDDLSIYIDTETTHPSFDQTERSIKQTALFRIEFQNEVLIETFIGLISQIANFLGLSMILPINPTMIRGETERFPYFVETNDGHPKPLEGTCRPIEVYYLLKDNTKQKERIYPFQMIFAFNDIKDNLQTYLVNWIENSEAIKPVYDLFFGDIYMSKMYHEMRFLMLMQGIETYHRRRRKNIVSDSTEHATRIQNILNSVPAECRKWLEGRLEYSNEPPLRQRIKEILSELPTDLKKLIGQESKFIYKVVATRNYLTHYNESLAEKAFKPNQLAHVIRKLRMILVFILLQEMGMDKESIGAFMTKNDQVRQNFYFD